MGAASGFKVVRGSRGDSNLLHLPLADYSILLSDNDFDCCKYGLVLLCFEAVSSLRVN